MQDKHIYLDHGATTPLLPAALEAMLPYFDELSGNPSSVHRQGQVASRAVEDSRRTIADLIGAAPDEIIFTGGGSESDNLALKGTMLAARSTGKGNHLITSAIEHRAVLETARQLEDLFGFDLTVVGVDRNGVILQDELLRAIRPDTAMISVMGANNEVGTIQPIEAIAALAREKGITFHTDAIQLAVVEDFDLRHSSIDLMSLSAHKFYGPKGVGVLYCRRGVDLVPLVSGGGHEHGMRAGTSNVPGIVGASVALKHTIEHRGESLPFLRDMTGRFIAKVLDHFGDSVVLTGHPTDRLAYNASFAFRNVSGNDLLMYLDHRGISASSGSACLSGDPEPSHVLVAIGLDETWSKGGMRFTFGSANTISEMELTLDALFDLVPRLIEAAG